MLDEKRVVLMTKMAMYEENNKGKEDIRVSTYFQKGLFFQESSLEFYMVHGRIYITWPSCGNIVLRGIDEWWKHHGADFERNHRNLCVHSRSYRYPRLYLPEMQKKAQ